jgi:hypothetical protein
VIVEVVVIVAAGPAAVRERDEGTDRGEVLFRVTRGWAQI